MATKNLRGISSERLDDVRIRTMNGPAEARSSIDSAMREVIKEAEHLIDHTIKAFGNCEICYGKGYATTIQYAAGRGESDMGEGHIEINEQLPIMRTCKCPRGEQLRKLMVHGKIG